MDELKPLGADSPNLWEQPPPPNLTAEQVYHDYASRVFHVARRMLSSDTDAEDVTQDVLLQVVRKLPSFRGEAAFPTWLHRVTINAALAHRRKRAVREGLYAHAPDSAFLEAGQRPGSDRPWVERPDETLLGRELHQLIDRAVTRLPETYREVFVLSDVEGLPNAEIAARLGLSLPAVKSRLHRARLLLRDALAPHFDEPAA
jgi:RNA polymerase sigma-70 factor (ECF subfamily)